MIFRKPALFFPLFLILLITSCESKKAELKSQSPDGNVLITVSGSKSSMEPWDLTIEIKNGDESKKMQTELYADELNGSNVLFSWTDDRTCALTLIHQDGESRLVEISI